MTTNRPFVLLLNAPVTSDQSKGKLSSVIKNLFFNSPPLGIAYIAAVLEKNDIPVQIIDAPVQGYDHASLVEHIADTKPDVIGITSTTTFFQNTLMLADMIKQRYPGAIIVIGGPHATKNHMKTMENSCFDFTCIGEGEFTMLDLVDALNGKKKLEEVNGIAFRKNRRVMLTPPRPLIPDLDILPFPARHLLPIKKYVPQPNDGLFQPKLSMVSSRGCPFQCIFCDHGIFGTTYRSLSAGRIVDEMEHLKTCYGAMDIAFVDSLFMLNIDRVNSIVDEILGRGLKVHWTCTIRANIVTKEILERMKNAGCWRVRIGIESGNDMILKFIKKQITREQAINATRAADELGLHPKGFFMIGHLPDTEKTIQDSIDFAKNLPLTDITVQINTPLPDTAQYFMASQYGKFITANLSSFSFWEPVFVPEGLSPEKIVELSRKFYRSFYLRPSVIWRHLRLLRRFSDIKRIFRGLSIMFSMLFSEKLSDAMIKTQEKEIRYKAQSNKIKMRRNGT